MSAPDTSTLSHENTQRDPQDYPQNKSHNDHEPGCLVQPLQPKFCHLSVRTEFSLVEGSLKIPDILDKITSLGHTHVAITDHGALFGALEFYKQCRKRDITPIIGCTLYMEPSRATSLFLKSPRAVQYKELLTQDWFQFTLLSKNNYGYGQLIQLVSETYEEGLVDDVPVCSWSRLAKHLDSSGLDNQHMIALTGASMGELYYLLKLKRLLTMAGSNCDDLSLIDGLIDDFLSHICHIFSQENIYAELVHHGLGYEGEINKQILALASTRPMGVVATADAYYLGPDDASSHTLALAIKNSLNESEIARRNRNCHFHLLNEKEFFEAFGDVPEAIEATLDIAERCSHVEISLSQTHLPSYPLGPGENENDLVEKFARGGLEQKRHSDPIIGEQINTYTERLEFELGIIKNMGFSGYFLIVQDFCNWARTHNIPVGPGRGSGAGSLVAYCLGITNIDPLRWGLIFERFLNPDRVSLPDFDIDFCQWRREDVLDYVRKKYGRSHVAHIGTYGKMMAKAAIKNVARVRSIHYTKMNHLTKMFPLDPSLTIPDVLEQYPEIARVISEDEDLEQVVAEAAKLEGMISHTSVHAAGVVIADQPITRYAPTFRSSSDPTTMTQYEMKSLEQVGLVKFDFLGLKTLTVIHKACELIRELTDPAFDINTIPLDDRGTYNSLSMGHTVGIFQAESHGMTALARKLGPSHFEDIIALVALFRPGPLGSGMVEDFIERKHLRQKITYLHPSLEPILSETYGMIVYQEQVQKIAATLANFSLGEADLLRRAMGKKIAEEMNQQKKRFMAGTNKNGINDELASNIFNLMAEFAKYGFNKSHSAAYGLLLYQTAYLKVHHPVAYMIGIMTCDMDQPKKLRSYIEECRRMGISVRPPCLQKSMGGFKALGAYEIAFALEAIKGIGKKTALAITSERARGGPFASPLELAHRLDLHHGLGKKNLELLITAGAVDGFGYRRDYLLTLLPDWVSYSQDYHQQKSIGQSNLFTLMATGSKKSKTPSEIQSAPKWYMRLLELSGGQKYPISFSALMKERALMGTYLSGHPMELFTGEVDFLPQSFSVSDVIARIKAQQEAVEAGAPPASEEIAILAFFSEAYTKTTQSGKTMASLRLEDHRHNLEALLFEKGPNTLPKLPAQNSYVWVKGQLSGGARPTFVIHSFREAISLLSQISGVLNITFDLSSEEAAHIINLGLLAGKGLAETTGHPISVARNQADSPANNSSGPWSWFIKWLDTLSRFQKKFPGPTRVCITARSASHEFKWDLGVGVLLREHYMALKSQFPERMKLSFERAITHDS